MNDLETCYLITIDKIKYRKIVKVNGIADMDESYSYLTTSKI